MSIRRQGFCVSCGRPSTVCCLCGCCETDKTDCPRCSLAPEDSPWIRAVVAMAVLVITCFLLAQVLS